MRISIDVDGVLTKYPGLFDLLARRLRGAGHQVGILSSRYKNGIPNEKFWDFVYKDVPLQDKWMTMVAEKVDLHFDDQADQFPEESKGRVIKI